MEVANSFQLPVIVRRVRGISGGHEVTVDVYSDQAFRHNVYQGLRCITAGGSPVDGTLRANQRIFLLGIFSINLKKAHTGE
jgi:hypothetical protein